MTTLTEKFTTLEEQLAAAAVIIQGYTDTVEPKLQAVLDLMDVMNVNNAANTRYLLSALNAIDPCATCPPPSVIVTPPDGTVYFPGAEACKRAQAFIAFMNSAMTVLDVVSGLGTGTFPSLVISAIQEVIDGNALYSGLPVISFPEGVSLVGNLINYGILNIGRGDTLSSQFGSISAGMLPVLYGASSADGAKSLYTSYVSGSGLPSDEIGVMNAAAYDAAFTWFFAPGSTPDLTPYDGGACGGGLPAITTCVDVVATVFFDGDADRYHMITAPTSGTDPEVIGDFFGFSFEIIEGVLGINTSIVYRPSGGGSRTFEATIAIGSAPHTVTHHTSTIDLYTDHDGSTTYPFTVRVCPPS
jgi:hypothetical protein